MVAAQTGVSLLVGLPSQVPDYVMPDLIDHPIDQVRPALQAKGLNVGTAKYEAYPGIADGIIIRQFPLHGAPVSGHDAISVVVSRSDQNGIIQQ